MNRRKIIFGSFVVALVVGVVALLLRRPDRQIGDGNGTAIKIGAIYPLTGPAASLGQEFRRGAELAGQIQPKGSRISVLFEDSKTDPKAAIAAYQKLRNEGVRFIITTVSSTALALEPITKQDGVLLFADVAQPGITGNNRLLFRHSSTADQEARVIFNHLTGLKLTAPTGLMWINDDYGAAFKQEMETLNSKAGSHGDSAQFKLTAVSFSKTDSDLRSEALQVLDVKPSIVIVAGFGKPLGLAIRRLRESGYEGTIIATMGFTVTPDAATLAGETAKGVLHSYMQIEETDPEYQTFANAYKERYGSNPPTYAALAYNTTLLLSDAIRSQGDNPEKVATAILGRSSFRAAGEEMTIRPNGDILPPVALKQFIPQPK